MLLALKNRGPDDSSTWERKNVLLGHTRLSIIDLKNSRQPMENEDGSVIVSYNGEIYNFRSLRQGLIAQGHVFRSKGDTEVLVHLYEELGPGMIRFLDGIFAFAIYDLSNHKLLLARDRIGVKPLYYWHNRKTKELVFASDLGAILANPHIPRRLHQQALAQFLHFGYVVHPLSWLEDVYQLEPGQILEWQQGDIKVSQYYEWIYDPSDVLADNKSAVEQLCNVLGKSVSEQLVSDVPLGAFLSGGVDSSTITALAQRALNGSGNRISSFNVRFWEDSYDESERAASIARDIGSRHTIVDAKQLTFNRTTIEQIIAGLGEPFGDISSLAVFTLCQHVRPYVKVALSGDGGDELFFGYSGMYKQAFAQKLQVVPSTIRRLALSFAAIKGTSVMRRANKYLRLSLHDDTGIIIEWSRRWEESELTLLLGLDQKEHLFPSESVLFPEVRSRLESSSSTDFREKLLRFHMLVDLPCDCLFKVDRMSMANSLEVRVPMLSNEMLIYSSQLPIAMRWNHKHPKEPLRTLAKALVPTLRTPHRKMGFCLPLTDWLSNDLLVYWKSWNITDTLIKLGFRRQGIDYFLSWYGNLNVKHDKYQANRISWRLFDLMQLAVWADMYRIKL